jgi:hypothetical protein
MSRRSLKTIAGLIGLVVITLLTKSVLLQGLPVTSLGSAPPIAGAVSQSLGLSASRAALPVFGKDYTLQDVHYFYNNEWAVATVAPTKPDADTVIVIVQKINGVYQTVLGPGTIFSSSYLYTLPPDVGQYLNKQGVLHG